MKVLIIEDEILAADHLEMLLDLCVDSVEVQAKIPTVEKTIHYLEEHHPPDLIFMDIQLADGICFDIFSRIEIKIPVIFTTAYDQYALKAFKVNSIDYLLKPINKDDLKKAIEKPSPMPSPSKMEGIIPFFEANPSALPSTRQFTPLKGIKSPRFL